LKAACFLIASSVLLLPITVRAQSATTGSIAGVAKDTSGSVLPGVVVEVASPALIEKVRSAVTDGQGNYKIVDLRPGTYSVTFTLSGFATFRREGIELPPGFTATANAELQLGSLEETITVSGGTAPIVDIQNVRSQTVLTRTFLDAVPTAQSFHGFAALTLGVTVGGSANTRVDVGGNNTDAENPLAIHGSRTRDLAIKQDGFTFGIWGGATQLVAHNQAAIQEMVIETGGVSADTTSGGIQINAVPKEGSNTFRGSLFGDYTNQHFSAGEELPGNIVARLGGRSLTVPTIKEVYDYRVGLGGPIKQDTLWFYTAHRWWSSSQYAPGNYYNQTPNTMFYTPDLTRPAYFELGFQDSGVRFTWQLTSKQKIAASYHRQTSCDCWNGTLRPVRPEAANSYYIGPTHMPQATWTYAATNRLLFEGGMSLGFFPWQSYNELQTAEGINILELSTGYSYGAPAALRGPGARGHFLGRELANVPEAFDNVFNERFSVAYVTGSHAFKTGLALKEDVGEGSTWTWVPHEVNYQFRNGVPVGIVQRLSPTSGTTHLREIGLFAQDQWTVRRLTLNLGLRYDRARGFTPAAHITPNRFVAPFDIPAVNNIPSWHDVNPRLGAAYDLFGDGKTAIKGSFGRYVFNAIDRVRSNHPLNAVVTAANRTWNDLNGNYVPDCDLDNRASNGECGAISNNAFGTSVVSTRYADDVQLGWGSREFNWQAAAILQHQLRPGLGLNISYHRTWYGNFLALVNEAVTASDFDPFCITVPTDARLPGGGGNELCGFFDVNPAKFGQVSSLATHASNFGKQEDVFNGVDVGVTARFWRVSQLQGGVSTGRTVVDVCYAANSPNITPSAIAGTGFRAGPVHRNFCRISPPWSAATQVKLAGVVSLPWQADASFTFQDLPGTPRSADMVVTSAQVAPSLGRTLAAGANATAVIQILPDQRYFENRSRQLDIRLSKSVQVRRAKIRGMLDIYNILGERAIVDLNGRYGPNFLVPTVIMAPRLFKLGAQVDF
jgi:hypothetical protein